MANHTKTGKFVAGNKFTVDGVTVPPVGADNLTINGTKQTINEMIRRGRIRAVSTAGNITTYHMLSDPAKDGNKAGG